MNPTLDRLETLGAIRAVDAALGRLLAEKSPRAGAHIALLAAATSAALDQGHSCLPLAALPEFVAGLLAVGVERPPLPGLAELREALTASPLVARDGARASALVFDAAERVYLHRYFHYERDVAAALRARLAPVDAAEPEVASLRADLARYFELDRCEPDWQALAVLIALRARLTILTGGPGTGKTSAVVVMLVLLVERRLAAGFAAPRIALTAPTGKAAARMNQALHARLAALTVAANVRAALPQVATTLHRLLGAMPGRAGARHDRAHPLPYDVIVVDEASMLDLALAARLCAAMPTDAHLLLLGDRDQLASVEAGSVFGALCAAAGTPNRYSPALAEWLGSVLGTKVQNASALPALPALTDAVVELRHSRRFGSDSPIGRFAQAVRNGDTAAAQAVLQDPSAQLGWNAPPSGDLARAISDQVVPHYVELLSVTTPEAALTVAERFRVLCALREGRFGASALNGAIELALRRTTGYPGADPWFAGRAVLIVANDYRSGLFNGDVGVALASGPHGAIEVWFRMPDGLSRAFAPALLPLHESAFAMTVHKAQGSEFDAVLVVLPQHDARVLSRELLYTAVTRARNKVQLWITPEILATTLARSTQRWSGMSDALGAPVTT